MSTYSNLYSRSRVGPPTSAGAYPPSQVGAASLRELSSTSSYLQPLSPTPRDPKAYAQAMNYIYSNTTGGTAYPGPGQGVQAPRPLASSTNRPLPAAQVSLGRVTAQGAGAASNSALSSAYSSSSSSSSSATTTFSTRTTLPSRVSADGGFGGRGGASESGSGRLPVYSSSVAQPSSIPRHISSYQAPPLAPLAPLAPPPPAYPPVYSPHSSSSMRSEALGGGGGGGGYGISSLHREPSARAVPSAVSYGKDYREDEEEREDVEVLHFSPTLPPVLTSKGLYDRFSKPASSSSSSSSFSSSILPPMSTSSSLHHSAPSRPYSTGAQAGIGGYGGSNSALPSSSSSSSSSRPSSVGSTSSSTTTTTTTTSTVPLGLSTVGLTNLGNTCYLNATLQCLAHVPPLAAFFSREEWSESLVPPTTPRKATVVKLARSFAGLLRDLSLKSSIRSGSSSSSKYVTPSELRSIVGSSLSQGSLFAGHAQNDAHELLRFFLDALGEALNRSRGKPQYRELQEGPGDPDATVADMYWSSYLEHGNSVVSDVFRGQLRSTLTCGTCRFTSRSFEPFEELTLQISRAAQAAAAAVAGSSSGGGRLGAAAGGGGGVSITDILTSFTQPEVMEGEEAWVCPRCKCPRTSTKAITVYRAPKVLTLVLKRFNFSSIRRVKIDTPVVLGEGGGLALGPFMSDSLPRGTREAAVYDLIGTVNHSGSTQMGHYTADARVGASGWYNFNDSTAHKTEVSLDRPRREPYVLFYERRDRG